MNSEFSRIITHLRKAKGLSQKQVAKDMGISQGLLSHYEKGIRECGLDFLVKTADYYDVSVDYLLGRTPNRDGSKIQAEDIPDYEDVKDINQGKTDNYCLINRKILNNSIGVIYNIMAQMGNRKLNKCISQYLMVAVYNIFIILHSLNNNESKGDSHIPDSIKVDYCHSSMTLDLLKIKEIKEKNSDKYFLDLSQDALVNQYPESYDSFINLLKNSEKAISQKFKL